MNQQAGLLDDTDWDWLLITDAGRADVFEDIHQDYLAGDYQRVHNGGCLNTPAWFARHFSRPVDGLLFHGGTPIHAIDAPPDYDDREWFAHIPAAPLYGMDQGTIPPASVNSVVRQHLPERADVHARLAALGYGAVGARGHDEMVVRYVQPHRPYRTLDTEPGQRPDASVDAVWAAYEDNYRWVLDGIAGIVDELPGRVVVTADHGDCLLDCGQWQHGPTNDAHDHLVEVPWLEVDE